MQERAGRHAGVRDAARIRGAAALAAACAETLAEAFAEALAATLVAALAGRQKPCAGMRAGGSEAACIRDLPQSLAQYLG